MDFQPVKAILPEVGEEVILYNPKWKDSESNVKGMRIGYVSDDDVWTSAEFSMYKDSYFTRESDVDDKTFENPKSIDQVPTHWCSLPDFSCALEEKRLY